MKLRNIVGALACGAALSIGPAVAAAQDTPAAAGQSGQQDQQQRQQPTTEQNQESAGQQDRDRQQGEAWQQGQDQPRAGQQGQDQDQQRTAGQDQQPTEQHQRAGEQGQQDQQRADDRAGQQGQQGQQHAAGAAAGQQVNFREVRDNPDRFFGQTVSFEANVDDVLGPRVLRMSSTGFFDWFGGGMLAYAPDALGLAVTDRDRVRVTGTVERYDRQALERELAWIDAGEELDDRMRERPVIRVTSIERTRVQRNAVIRQQDDQQFAAGRDAQGQQQGGAVGTTGDDAPMGEHDEARTTERRDGDREAVGTAGEGEGRATTAGEHDRHTAGTAGAGEQARQPAGRTAFGTPIHDEDAMQDIGGIFGARRADVGRYVNLSQARVERTLGQGVFLVRTERDDQKVMVKVPEALGQQAQVQNGQSISFQGVVMQMPRNATRLPGAGEEDAREVFDRDVYVLATNIQQGQ
jgi:hypothetical protein